METTNSTGRSGSRHRRKRDSGNGHNEFSDLKQRTRRIGSAELILHHQQQICTQIALIKNATIPEKSEIRVATQGEGNFDEGADAVVDSRNKYLGITKEVLIAKALVDMGHQVTFKKGTSLRALLFSHI